MGEKEVLLRTTKALMKTIEISYSGSTLWKRGIILLQPAHPICEVMNMDRTAMEKQQQKRSNEEFNSITQKVKVENQNQAHNARKEGTTPINQKR